MADRLDGALNGWIVRALDGLADLAQPEGAQSSALLRIGSDGRLDLGDLHDAGASSAAGAGASSASGFSSLMPSTSRTVRPRSSATSSGARSCWSAVTVALTKLIGFWEPSDFESTSRMPASSSTARTP